MDWQTHLDHQEDGTCPVSEIMAQITLKRGDPPGHNGWQGYSHAVDVQLNGETIGRLVGSGHNKRRLEYGFETDHPARKFYPKFVLPVGLEAARKAVAKAVAKTESE